MLFSSIPFLFYYLPAVLILYFLVPGFLKNTVLLLASLFFYGWGEPVYLFLMLGSIALFWGCGMAMGRCKEQKWKKFWLIVSVVVSLALLAIFKYADFFISSVNAVTGLSIPLLRLALPIGISFYTFQCLSYTIDVYRGQAAVQKNPISFGAYVSLFPQLIAGPIVRYVDVARELDERTHSWDNVALGMRRFMIGLGKKILLANQFGELTNIFRASDEKSVVFYWIYAIAFTLHIYFDFSGYSDMAIGLGKVFGFNFIENFNYPYISRSIQEFWRRWHMSLGSWFRDYVYIPLGGNRVSRGRWIFNTMVVWFLTGMWHGASWNFILWGVLYGVLLLIEKFVPAIQKLPAALGHVYVMVMVMIGFVLFNAVDMAQAAGDLAGMFGLAGVPFLTQETVYYLGSYAVLFIAGFIGATPVVRNLAWKLCDGKVSGKVMAILEPVLLIGILLLCTAYLVDGSFNPFLYFRF
ncbi:MAG: MBOAT family protein [Oscillospiraceae bacterium]|nr:MBOAT family protein [Oscillospiraceae bacterium]